jgi:hypothetical protein
VSEDAGIEPRTVSTSALAVRRSRYSAHLIDSRVHLIHTRLPLIHTRLHLIHTQLHLIHTWLHLIHTQLHLIHTFFLFSSTEWFGTEFREFASLLVPRNGIPSCFLFRWRVRKEIPRIFFYFCSTERNSELFSRPLKGSKGNFESLLIHF